MNRKIIYFFLLLIGITFFRIYHVSAEEIPVRRKASVQKATVLKKTDLKAQKTDKLKKEAMKSDKTLKGAKIIDLKPVNAKEKTVSKPASVKEKVEKVYEKPKKESSPEIEIGLLSEREEVKIMGLQNFYIDGKDKKKNTYGNGKTLTMKRKGNKISVDGKTFDGPIYLSTGNDKAAFAVKGNQYRGKMKVILSPQSSGLTVVNVVPLELYLQGVVPSEIVPSWETDAIKAQAVAARTYALFHKNGYRSSGYDLTDDTRSQVYQGVGVETAKTNKAVMDTAGEVITYGGKAIDALFHANGGGHTENSENVWGTHISYLRGVKEESSGVVNKMWTKTVPLDKFTDALAGAGYNVGKIKKIILSPLKMGNKKSKDRGISGRVKFFEISGKNGKKQISGERLQGIFGLNSTLFDISAKGKNIIITGYGYGHGLGLSQWGAQAMAEKHGDGKDYYKKILAHYFTGTKIEKLY